MAHIVLAGAGHAHLHLVTQAAHFRTHRIRLTLVAPGRFWYSGRASAVLGGHYRKEKGTIDVTRLSRDHGVAYCQDTLQHLDPARQLVTLSDGHRLRYDRLSLNIGSRITPRFPITSTANTSTRLWTAKPVANLWALRQSLIRQLAGGGTPQLVVVGSGATGIEIAANLSTLCQRYGKFCPITLIGKHSRLLPQAPDSASRWIRRHLVSRGIRLQLEREVTFLDGSIIGGRHWSLCADHVVLATGLTPSVIPTTPPLPTCRGGLCVADTLQSSDAPHVFAAGDCAALESMALPKLGVHGVRQAPILQNNLLASLAGKPLKPYQPPPRSLQILELGNGQGLALRGNWWWAGRLSLFAKHRIDERFLRRYRR
ncbi:FAD-dependent oxidoreductase [Halomonas shantousis]